MVGAVAAPDQVLDDSPLRILPASLHIPGTRQRDVVVGTGREAGALVGDVAGFQAEVEGYLLQSATHSSLLLQRTLSMIAT